MFVVKLLIYLLWSKEKLCVFVFLGFLIRIDNIIKLIIFEYFFFFLYNVLEFLLSYEVLMYVIRDRNNVSIDLYFFCFISFTLFFFFMMKREKKN